MDSGPSSFPKPLQSPDPSGRSSSATGGPPPVNNTPSSHSYVSHYFGPGYNSSNPSLAGDSMSALISRSETGKIIDKHKLL